jgi:hypothetical protein
VFIATGEPLLLLRANSRNNCLLFLPILYIILGGRAGKMKGAGVAATQ